MNEQEYYDYSLKVGSVARCPLLNICERRALTLKYFALGDPPYNEIDESDYMPENYKTEKFTIVGESPNIIAGTNNYFYKNVCPETTLFDSSTVPFVVPRGIASSSGEYDKYYKDEKSKVLATKHFTQCSEYSKYTYESATKVKSISNENIFLNELLVKGARLLERKNTMQIENIHNDIFTDWLRDKSYYVTDQTRTGISQKKAGQPDILIREIGGNPSSIIECFRLKDCGPKNTDIAEHINRLINTYDATGLERSYIIVYAENKNFESLWSKYLAYLEDLNNKKEYSDVSRFIYLNDVTGSYSQVSNIKVVNSTHIRNKKEVNIFHLFLNFYVNPSVV